MSKKTIPKFMCVLCDYSTDTKICYNKHLTTIKHITKESENKKQNEETLNICHTNHICTYCQLVLSTSSSLARHHKICSERTQMETIIENLKNELNRAYQEKAKMSQEIDKIIVKTDKELNDKDLVIQDLRETIEFERVTSKSQLSTSNFLCVNYNSAPYTVKITDLTLFDPADMELLDALLLNKKDDTLVDFIGNVIVAYYKTHDPKDQSLWNSDVDRLTYFIKKQVGWTVDKKGVKTANIVICPVLNYFLKTLKKFIKIQPSRKMTTSQTLIDHERRKLCYDIITSINNGVLKQQILKFMAPRLHLNRPIKHKQKKITKD